MSIKSMAAAAAKMFTKEPVKAKKAKAPVVAESPVGTYSPSWKSPTKKVKVARKLRKDEKKLLAKTRAGNRKANNKGRSH